MAIKLIEDSILTDIANAIREKLNTVSFFKPNEMANAIKSITTGGGSASSDTRTFIMPTLKGKIDKSNTSLRIDRVYIYPPSPTPANNYMKITIRMDRVATVKEKIYYDLGYINSASNDWADTYCERSNNNTNRTKNSGSYFYLVDKEMVCYWKCKAGTTVANGGTPTEFYATIKANGTLSGDINFEIDIEFSPEIDAKCASGEILTTYYSTRTFPKRLAY